MNNVAQLTEIETRLRQPASDRALLAQELMILSAIIAHDGQNETGLIRGAIGGMQYCLNRLRKIWQESHESEPPSFEKLEDLYAQVQLSRYAFDNQVIDATKKKLLADCTMARIHVITLSDGTEVTVFASDRDQYTVDGIRVEAGEMLEASSAMVPTFQQYYHQLLKEKKVG